MVKIFFISSWQKNMAGYYDIYTPGHDGVWGSLRSCNDKRKADIFVVMQGGGGDVDRRKTVFFQREPLARHGNFANALYYGSYKNHYHVCTWWVLKKFRFLESLGVPNKTKKLSAIISGKSSFPGHKARFRFIKEYSKRHRIDWYGSGIRSNMPGYLGPLPGRCKFAGLARYKYSLAFENSRVNNYFTEKIVDCFLTYTKPIYWGCPNIADYFPEGSYAEVDITKDPEEVMQTINEELKKPIDYKAIREARRLVLYKYNLWPSLVRIL